MNLEKILEHSISRMIERLKEKKEIVLIDSSNLLVSGEQLGLYEALLILKNDFATLSQDSTTLDKLGLLIDLEKLL